jgi:hypothetical protein
MMIGDLLTLSPWEAGPFAMGGVSPRMRGAIRWQSLWGGV